MKAFDARPLNVKIGDTNHDACEPVSKNKLLLGHGVI